MTQKVITDPVEYAHLAVEVASDKQAVDIVMLDIHEISDFTDFFVIMTAESTRQMRSLASDLEDALEEAGAVLHHREGTHLSGWMLLDFADIIVHLFGPEERDFYQIERAWSEAVEVVRIQ